MSRVPAGVGIPIDRLEDQWLARLLREEDEGKRQHTPALRAKLMAEATRRGMHEPAIYRNVCRADGCDAWVSPLDDDGLWISPDALCPFHQIEAELVSDAAYPKQYNDPAPRLTHLPTKEVGAWLVDNGYSQKSRQYSLMSRTPPRAIDDPVQWMQDNAKRVNAIPRFQGALLTLIASHCSELVQVTPAQLQEFRDEQDRRSAARRIKTA